MKFKEIILAHRCCAEGWVKFNEYIKSEELLGNSYDHKMIYGIFQIKDMQLDKKYNFTFNELVKYSFIINPDLNIVIRICN